MLQTSIPAGVSCRRATDNSKKSKITDRQTFIIFELTRAYYGPVESNIFLSGNHKNSE